MSGRRLAAAVVLAAIALALGAVLAVGASGPQHARQPDPSASATGVGVGVGVVGGAELAYLTAAQNQDGGFGAAPGQASSELYTAWAAIGIAAAGRDPLEMRRSGHTVLDALRGEASTLSGAGDLERTILALHACGVSVRSLGAAGDPLAELLRMRSPDGSFGGLANLTAFGVLALRAGGYGAASTPVRLATRWLARQQDADGGFGFAGRGGASDVDDTAAVLQALLAGHLRGSVPARARTFILHAENADGGFPEQPGGASNAQSTAWAIQGLTAAGVEVSNLRTGASRTPVAYLQSLVAPDGSVRYSRVGAQTPVWVTAQALTGLARRPFPIVPPRARRAAG